MSDNVTSYLEQRRKRRGGDEPPSSPPPPPSGGKPPYVAARVDRDRERQPCVIVHYSNGYTEVLPYIDLRRVLFAHGGLVIFFPTGIIDIEGENLVSLTEDFQQLRIIALTPYDAERFEPPEEGQPVISRISWILNEDIRPVRPEDLQPATAETSA